MRSKIVEEQLQRCQVANIKDYDDSTKTFHIKRYSKPKFEKGKCYLVHLSNEIVNNTSSLLSVNWNNGRAPEHNYYKVYISATMGKMIKVDSIAFDYENKLDLDKMFSGWLDTEYLHLLEEI